MEKLYRVSEVAEILGLKRQTVSNYIYEGKIKTTSLMGATRVTETELKKLISGEEN